VDFANENIIDLSPLEYLVNQGPSLDFRQGGPLRRAEHEGTGAVKGPVRGGGMDAATCRWAMDGPSAGPGSWTFMRRKKAAIGGAVFFGSFLLGEQKK